MIPFEPSIEAAVLPLRPKVILVGDASQGDIAATLLAMFDRNDRETNSKKYISMHLSILNSVLNLHYIHHKKQFPFIFHLKQDSLCKKIHVVHSICTEYYQCHKFY